MKRKQPVKTQNFYILLALLLITIALLIAVSIYCYLIKDVDIKNLRYYFFDYIINIKYFDPNNIKIE